MTVASVGDFFDAVDTFLSNLAAVHWGSLLLGLFFFAIYLTLRSRAYFNVLRAAFPDVRIRWRRIWGAYVAAYGFNNVVPARGGDIMKLFLVRSSVSGSAYPSIGSSFFVEAVFDATIAVPVLIFAFTQGVFPKPPDFSTLGAFDLSFFAGHVRFTLFAMTAVAVLALVGFAVLSRRIALFWARVRQGLAILFDRERYLREVFAVQLLGWLFRCAAFWCLLDAFGIGGSVRNVLLVLGVNAIASLLPFTPGGAGVQQAFLVTIFGGGAAAYSVGQQMAIAVLSLGLGFVAVVVVFRFRSFREVIQAGRDARLDEGAEGVTAAGERDPRAP